MTGRPSLVYIFLLYIFHMFSLQVPTPEVSKHLVVRHSGLRRPFPHAVLSVVR